MEETLGICVTTRNCMSHLIGIARAARIAGKKLELFLTGEGVHLTQEKDFSELVDLACVAVCEVSYIANGYKGQELHGLGDKDFMTQAKNAEMAEECDRYMVL